MKCAICSIGNKELLQEIEYLLEVNDGMLHNKDKVELIEKYPAYKEAINKITDQDCNMHWNFHQSVDRPIEIFGNVNTEKSEGSAEKPTVSSLTADIAKDEATILYEVLNAQAATFRCLDRKIKRAIEKADTDDDGMSQIIVNPNTVNMYNEVASSIRQTTREIREMNKELNGKGEDPLAGIKALAVALTASRPTSSSDPSAKEGEPEGDMSTKEFDD